MPYLIYLENLFQMDASVEEGDVVGFGVRWTDASSPETLLFSTLEGTAPFEEGDDEKT